MFLHNVEKEIHIKLGATENKTKLKHSTFRQKMELTLKHNIDMANSNGKLQRAKL